MSAALPANATVLITGCSSGIGEACARALRADGWRVLVTARKRDDLKRLSDEGFEAFALDYAKPETIEALAYGVLERLGGPPYGLFHNGAYGLIGAVEDLSVAALRAQFEANVLGWHDLTRRLLPEMIGAGEGRVVLCSSVLGFVTVKYRGGYGASKYALEALADAMRLELDGTGVQVALINPGPITTRFAQNAREVFREVVDIPRSRFAETYREGLATSVTDRKPKAFALPPSACIAPLRHALTARRARPRYFVTHATRLMAIARRVLPMRLLDRLAAANSRF